MALDMLSRMFIHKETQAVSFAQQTNTKSDRDILNASNLPHSDAYPTKWVRRFACRMPMVFMRESYHEDEKEKAYPLFPACSSCPQ